MVTNPEVAVVINPEVVVATVEGMVATVGGVAPVPNLTPQQVRTSLYASYVEVGVTKVLVVPASSQHPTLHRLETLEQGVLI